MNNKPHALETKLHLHRLHCSVCAHPEVSEVDDKLRAGVTQAAIMREYGFSRDAMRNHIKAVRVFEAGLVEKKSILGRLLWHLSDKAAEAVAALDPKDAIAALHKTAELLAKVDGDLVARHQTVPPEFKDKSEDEIREFVASGGNWPDQDSEQTVQ